MKRQCGCLAVRWCCESNAPCNASTSLPASAQLVEAVTSVMRCQTSALVVAYVGQCFTYAKLCTHSVTHFSITQLLEPSPTHALAR